MKKRLVILGAGESGFGTAVLGLRQGYDVFVSDIGKVKEHYAAKMREWKIEYEEGKHTEDKILNADLVMKSPGIPDTVPIVQKIRRAGIPVVSEIEFASWFTQAKIVGITGSNGKTTTTALTYHILKNGGLNVGLGGNIGQSFAYQVAMCQYDYYVLEISSFQLDDIEKFRPQVAVLTNITPDHLDRYDYELKNYVRAKFNITRNQGPDDYFVYCADDPITAQYMTTCPGAARKIPFSQERELPEGGYVKDNHIIIHINQNQFTMSIQELGLTGRHNVYNSLAAGIVANVYGLRKEQIRESLADMRSLEHRMETVAKIRNIEFINDSKATNVNSAWYALESINKPIIWIAGGVDKGNDYSVLEPLVRKKVKAMICLGLDNTKLHAAFGKMVDVIINVTSMHDAVRMAYSLGVPGDCVLLSPACASFDLFENYEDRGKKFKEAVIQL
ncbi:MAG: UDP-N-acetylmuramoyl-L-alanine--D-glutamate ligase [Chitinophagales bacterium]|nr:UDP-N-acetylmuramoyl-L-alanine--D-glutamate ligase [Chitinophagales bacterium]MDW8418834.1 UDP-N-acetylmuramoyl-L-alanine--D-glutamate ligase [Chitinophagales bacterium]